jgi:diguanylate cyclase (GGDEF)-like protein/PAS domain S-box-containing protein
MQPEPQTATRLVGSVRPLGRLRLRPAIAVSVACIIALLAGGIVVYLDNAERLARGRELELNQVQVLVERLAGSEWQALAEGRTDATMMTGFRETWSSAKQALVRLRSESPSEPRLSRIVLAFDAYVADVDQELEMLFSGAIEDARRFEEGTIAPVHDLLETTLLSTQASYHNDAQRAASRKAINSVITVIVASGLIVGLLWFVRRSQARAERRFRALVQHSSDVYSILDLGGTIVYESPAVERVLGYPLEERLGTNANGFIHSDDASLARTHMQQLLSAPGAEVNTELRVRHADGTWRRIVAFGKNLASDPAIGGIAVTYRDVTEQRAMEEQLRRQALEDPLTGLSNRALLRDRLEHAVARLQRVGDGQRLAVFFLDLDDFKTVNDSLGHAAGDLLLTAVGQRLSGAVRAIDTVARLGGDEFAVLAEDIPAEMDPNDLGRRLIKALMPAFQVGETEVFVRASVGYAVAAPGDDGDLLLRNADLAMYQAKAEGKSRLRRYDPGLHTTAVARLELEHDLRVALEARQFVIEYQPIVALESDRIVGLEALLRWNHPTRGILEPDRFIPLAEESGLIVEIGRWVMSEACRQLSEWIEQGLASPELTLSVNLSVKQVHDAAIVDDVATALRNSGLPGHRLTLEVTEGVLVDDSEAVIGRLAAIREMGVRIAIDDFGTGFSSLGYLSRFPVDVLKIDRSFVQRMSAKASDLAVIEAAIGLAATLGLETVAEGIERSGQTERLRELGCRLGQGFLFSRPAGASQIADALRTSLNRDQRARVKQTTRRPAATRRPRAAQT